MYCWRLSLLARRYTDPRTEHMLNRFVLVFLAACSLTFAQTPDLSGIWQAMNTANWDLQAHAASAGPISSLGAIGGIPPGESVIEGGTIPYLPAAAAQQKE